MPQPPGGTTLNNSSVAPLLAAQRRLDPGDEHLGAKRLDDVVVGALAETGQPA